MLGRGLLGVVLLVATSQPVAAQWAGTYSVSEAVGQETALTTPWSIPWSEETASASTSGFRSVEPYYTRSARAYSSITLAGGVQRAFASSTVGTQAYTHVGLKDLLTFSLTETSDSSQVATVTFTYSFSGTLTQYEHGSGFALGGMMVYDPTRTLAGDFRAQSYEMSGGSSRDASHGGFDSSSVVRTGDSSWAFSGTYVLSDPTTYFFLSSYLEAYTNDGATADFSHTARLGIQLSDGVAFTSASGVFLSAAGVPEPRSWALLIMGMGLVGWAMRVQARAALSPGRSSAPRFRR